ncbi:hypothetical protein D3C85_1251050 [compost metagenome]
MHLLDNVFDHLNPLSAGSAVQVKGVGTGVTVRRSAQTVNLGATNINSGQPVEHHVFQLLSNLALGVTARSRVKALAFGLHGLNLAPAEAEARINDRNRRAGVIDKRCIGLSLAATIHAHVHFARIGDLLEEVNLLADRQAHAQARKVVENGQFVTLNLDTFLIPYAPYVFRYGHRVAIEHAIGSHVLMGLVICASFVLDELFLRRSKFKHQSAP